MRMMTKLFTSKGGAFSNLWIEGVRLREAGFNIDTTYHQTWFKNRLVLSLNGYADEAEVAQKTITRKVMRADAHPCIRIEGKRVQDTFSAGNGAVDVTFSPGMIEIVPHVADPLPAFAHAPQQAAA